MNIEDAIRETAAKGRFVLSLTPTSSGGFQANFSLDRKSWRCEMASDPVTAIQMVLGLIPGASGSLRPELHEIAKDKNYGSLFD